MSQDEKIDEEYLANVKTMPLEFGPLIKFWEIQVNKAAGINTASMYQTFEMGRDHVRMTILECVIKSLLTKVQQSYAQGVRDGKKEVLDKVYVKEVQSNLSFEYLLEAKDYKSFLDKLKEGE